MITLFALVGSISNDRLSFRIRTDLSSFGFCRSGILNDEDWLWMVEEQWGDGGVRVMAKKGEVLVTKVTQDHCAGPNHLILPPNIKHARKAIVEDAAQKGAQLVVLPEIWNSPYSNDSFPVYAEDIDAGHDASPSTAMLAEVSGQLKITIVGGSIAGRCGDKEQGASCFPAFTLLANSLNFTGKARERRKGGV
ncbi:hypothetical protein V6N13_098056 [Hibiscus sabdariffa]